MTTKPAFTPGPWKVGPFVDKCYRAIDGFGWTGLARVVCRLDGRDVDSSEGMANARLIAAAPVLYNAAAACLAQVDRDAEPTDKLYKIRLTLDAALNEAGRHDVSPSAARKRIFDLSRDNLTDEQYLQEVLHIAGEALTALSKP